MVYVVTQCFIVATQTQMMQLKECREILLNVATFNGPSFKLIEKLCRDNYSCISRHHIKNGTNHKAVVVATFNEGHNQTFGL